ncbi:uncharacterized protein VP01_530g6 [Puccinia sorghi]|uniref:HAT C-terminal dimerisation domain-containing protein n=1 Tax=Puccinia sorghi TaxID=27349 RepID=A0A0L6UM86_9BASI|nr:uncharacterized protein VP01_530g6 [Puccinia sorghi]
MYPELEDIILGYPCSNISVCFHRTLRSLDLQTCHQHQQLQTLAEHSLLSTQHRRAGFGVTSRSMWKKIVKCLAPNRKKSSNTCGIFLAHNLTSSTKSMSEHLKWVHQILPPNQEKANQLLLPNLMKQQRVEHCGPFKIRNDVPFSIFKRLSFHYLLELLNPQTSHMEFSQKSIKSIFNCIFIAHRDHNQKILSIMKHISFTVNAWTSPNMKTFMEIMAHCITPDWKIWDLLIGMPAFEGKIYFILFFPFH